MLGALPRLEVVGEAGNGQEALDLIEATTPDAVFLDVQMPELDGLGVVAALTPAEAPHNVFVTAFDRYALQAFERHAVDYLLKPFDSARLGQSVERLRQRRRADRALELEQATRSLAGVGGERRYLGQIAARGVGRTIVVPVDSIAWIEAADNYVRLHTSAGVHLSRRSLKDLESLLDPTRFARIHRSSMVRLGAVRELRSLGDGDWEVLLRDDTRLTLTRSFRDRFVELLGGIA
jgi:two-component system LytT family response regulator